MQGRLCVKVEPYFTYSIFTLIDTKLKNHNLPYNPFKSCIVLPRPIGWISTLNQNGTTNLAPFSYFNAVSDVPPIVIFSCSQKATGVNKDTLHNALKSGEFVVNIATWGQREDVVNSSQALTYGKSEATKFGIETVPSNLVGAMGVKNSPIRLECKVIKTTDLNFENHPSTCNVVFGHAVGIYFDEEILTLGKVDIAKLKPIARLGYNEYAVIEKVFQMNKV